jgi:tetratricopeptide (TPR) repeat protein
MTNLAEVLHDQGKLEEAESCYLRALRHMGWREDLSERPDISSPTTMRAWPLCGYGELLLEKGDLERAEEVFREGVAIAESADWSDTYWLADARLRLGYCLARRGQYEQAESLMVGSNTILQAAPDGYVLVKGTTYWTDFRSIALERMVDLYERWDKPAKAETFRAQSAELEGP